MQNYLANRLREVYLNGTWIANTNYKTELLSTTWQQAIKKYESLNTIAMLTYHINYYLEGIINVFKGGDLVIRDNYSFDAPKINNENDWLVLITTFLSNSETFANNVEKLPTETLNSIFVDEKYGSYLRNIEGVLEHSYYHLGQIILIKKIISSE